MVARGARGGNGVTKGFHFGVMKMLQNKTEVIIQHSECTKSH